MIPFCVKVGVSLTFGYNISTVCNFLNYYCLFYSFIMFLDIVQHSNTRTFSNIDSMNQTSALQRIWWDDEHSIDLYNFIF